MNGKSALVVGANGQIGSKLVQLLRGNVLRTSRRPSPHCEMVLDLEEIAFFPERAAQKLRNLNVSAVFCAGGATNVEQCETDEQWAMNTNCLGPALLAAACTHIPFVYFSTEYIFDGDAGPYDEAAVPNPLSVYGRSKLEGEKRILDSHPKPLILRTTVVYGHDSREKNFIYTVMKKLARKEVIAVARDQVSSPTYNVDLAKAAVALVQRGHSGVFNVSGPECMSRYEFAIKIADVMRLDASLVRPAMTADLLQRAARPLAAGLSIDRVTQVLGSEFMRSVKEGLLAFRDNETVGKLV